ncbi:MAG: Spy/CpxP family protein refolding chaperone [Acidobacteria bacterium]|nr:Spy/CpxP family protein refolding chaperone [Acidobacteriota bacterium]
MRFRISSRFARAAAQVGILGLLMVHGLAPPTLGQAGVTRGKLAPLRPGASRPGNEARQEQRGEARNPALTRDQLIATRLQILRMLNLTPDQAPRIRGLLRTMQGRMGVLRESLEEKRDARDQALYAASVDSRAVEELTASMREIQAQIFQLEIRMELDFRAILTPEQLSQIRDLLAEQAHVNALRRQLNRSERALQERMQNPARMNETPP